MRVNLRELWVLVIASDRGDFDLEEECLYSEVEAKELAETYNNDPLEGRTDWIAIRASECLAERIREKMTDAWREGTADGREDAGQDRD